MCCYKTSKNITDQCYKTCLLSWQLVMAVRLFCELYLWLMAQLELDDIMPGRIYHALLVKQLDDKN